MSPTSLAELVDALRHEVMPVSISGEPTRLVHGVELLDREAAQAAVGLGQLLLGVGLDVHTPEQVDAALAIAAGSDGALAVKMTGQPPERLLRCARATGVTLVCVDPAVPWSRLQRLVSTLLATHPGSGSTLGGGDLFALANSVAAAVGGAVAIMDTSQAIVAYSNLPDQPIDETRRRGILGRRVPEYALPDHLAEEIWRSTSVVRHQRDGDLPRLAVVIRAGDDILGSLWAAFAAEPAIPDCAETLLWAARLAALHMLALRRQLDSDQNSRNRAFRTALDTEVDTALDRPGADPVGLRLPAVLVGADLSGPAQAHATNLLRLLDLFSLDGRALGHQPAVALSDDRVYTLLPVRLAATVSATALIDHLRDRSARTLHLDLTTVSAGEVTTPAELRGARCDIDSVLEHLHETAARPGHYTTERLRAELVRKRLLDTVRSNPLLRTGLGERIVAYDREHDTEFAATLLAYLCSFGDVVAASTALPIHQNTLRQRLRRASELFDIDLGNPAQRLLLEIELAAAG